MHLTERDHGASQPAVPFGRRVPLDEIVALIPALRRQFGITLIADITRLDRIGITTISAMVPRSRDTITVYSSSAMTPDGARVAAVMEAVERQTCAAWEPARKYALRARRLARTFDLESVEFIGTPGDEIPCEVATTVGGAEEVLVPCELVRCPWPERRQFRVISTNGLAAGSDPVEATYHALHELVERYLFARAEAWAHVLPRALALGYEQITKKRIECLRDDPCGTAIRVPTGRPVLDDIVAAITRAEADVELRLVRNGALPYLAVATVTSREEVECTSGFGCSYDSQIALVRALLEAVQSRVVWRSGAREDVLRANDDFHGYGDEVRRPTALSLGRWWFDVPAETDDCIPRDGDEALDLPRTLQRLNGAISTMRGHQAACSVEMPVPGFPLSVVRVVAPHLSDVPSRLAQESPSMLRDVVPRIRKINRQ
jgi:ribosomal protein S12 methylthiotransferase accessory factor